MGQGDYVQWLPQQLADAVLNPVHTHTHLKCKSLKVKCVSTMPVVFTRVRSTSCCVGM